MNKLYKDLRINYEDLYWIIDGDCVFHLRDVPRQTHLLTLKEKILKSDYLVLEYI